MRRFPLLLIAAWGLYAPAWFLTAYDDGRDMFRTILPGWEAFWLALTASADHSSAASWLWFAIGKLSALTNLLMVATPVLARRTGRRKRRWLAWSLLAAFAIDTYWAWPLEESILSELRAGYWLWLGSFGLAALALARQPAAEPAAE